MVEISQEYDDTKIVNALKELHPDIDFGKSGHVHGVDVNRKRVLSVTVQYSLTVDELDTILAASRSTPKTRVGAIL